MVADFGLARVFHPLNMPPSTKNKKRLLTQVTCNGSLSVTAFLSFVPFSCSFLLYFLSSIVILSFSSQDDGGRFSILDGPGDAQG